MAANEQPKKWKCINCNQEFMVGEWACSDGISNHVVEEKTYRVLDAPSDAGKPAFSLHVSFLSSLSKEI